MRWLGQACPEAVLGPYRLRCLIILSPPFECREVGLFVSLSSFCNEHCIAEPDACLHVVSSRRSCDRVSKVLRGSFFDAKVIFAEFFNGILTRPCDAKQIKGLTSLTNVPLAILFLRSCDGLGQQRNAEVHITCLVITADFGLDASELCL